MNTSNQTFTYTARRAAYLSTVMALLFIMLAEGSLITYVITLFIHDGWLKLAPVSLVGGFLLYLAFGVLLAPLYTKHQLTESHLLLRYGFALNIRVPRTEIVAARPVHEQFNMLQPMKAAYDAKKQRIVAAFSDQGQVLLHLDKPHAYKVGGTSVLVETILLNVDHRDEFLVTLGFSMNDEVPASRRGGGGEDEGRGRLRRPRPVLMTETSPHTSQTSRRGGGGADEGRGHLRRPRPVPLAETSPLATQGDALPAGKGSRSVPSTPNPTPAPTRHNSSRMEGVWAIRTENLTRSFKRFNAVDNLNLSIAQGEIYGFLGSNGAGKTTTIKMLVGLLEPSGGRAWIAGHNVWTEPLAAKAVSGYVADRAILYERLTGREFLNFLGQMRGIPLSEAEQRIKDLLDMLELTEHAGRPCGAYSFGMKRKLALARALLHRPAVLILDEPLNGLDPRSSRRLKDLFIEQAAGGTTILLSTHDLATAEAVCHRVGIIHRGQLLVEGSAAELEKMASASDLEEVFLSLTAEQREEVSV